MNANNNKTELTKAYEINLYKTREGYLYSRIFCYANTRGDAKNKLLEIVRYDDLELVDGQAVNFLNAPIKRAKDLDKIEYNGEVMTREEAQRQENILEHNNKLQQVLDDHKVTHAYIYKFGRSYYRSNYCGYTERESEAGVYTKEAAVKECEFPIEENKQKLNFIYYEQRVESSPGEK